MRVYRRNTTKADIVRAHPTAGLPLFADENKGLSNRAQQLAEQAPKAIEVATPTRNLAHQIIMFDPHSLAMKQMDVFKAIEYLSAAHGDATNSEIAEWIPRSINRVVGRTFELREMGYVVPGQKRQCRITKELVQAWKVNPDLRFRDIPHYRDPRP